MSGHKDSCYRERPLTFSCQSRCDPRVGPLTSAPTAPVVLAHGPGSLCSGQRSVGKPIHCRGCPRNCESFAHSPFGHLVCPQGCQRGASLPGHGCPGRLAPGGAEEEPGALTRRKRAPPRPATAGCEASLPLARPRSRSARFCSACRRLCGSSR